LEMQPAEWMAGRPGSGEASDCTQIFYWRLKRHEKHVFINQRIK
jgi:hypothetical protein